jgi:hypothetical protein
LENVLQDQTSITLSDETMVSGNLLSQVQNRIIKIRDAPDTVFAGYPAGRISGYSKSRIPVSGKGWLPVPDIWPDTWLVFG